MIVIGVDPGLRGAIVAVDDKLQVVKVDSARGWVKSGRYREEAMLAHLVRYTEIQPSLIVIEEQHARPDEGVVSSFTNGIGFGLWRGLTAHIADRRMVIDPRRWQAVVHKGALGATTKRRSIHVARVRLGLDVDDHNVADAACIALYGLHVLGVGG